MKGKTATRVFCAPGSPYYSRTRADVWFRTDDDARARRFHGGLPSADPLRRARRHREPVPRILR